jgi:Ca2+-binding RTX toxin-like protein
MSNTTTQSVGQQHWSNQYNALNNSLRAAAASVDAIRQLYGVGRPSSPSLTSDQQRNLEQAYQHHLEASAAVTSFVTGTQGQMLRMSVTADALAADASRSLWDREYARQTSATLQQRTIEFLQVKSNESWQVPSSLQYTVDHKILAAGATGIVERGTDTSTTAGKVIAAFDTVKNLLSSSLADGAQTVQQLREIGLNLPNDYEICVAIMGIPSGRVIKELLPMPDSFKSWPTLPSPFQMPWDTKTIGEKLYKDGVKSVIKSITAEEEFCKVHLNKSDVKDLLRKYGLADDALFDRMDLLGVDEIAFNVSREFFNQALATQAVLSSLSKTSGLTAAVFDQQVRQATASLSSSATLMATYAHEFEAAGFEALDGAVFGEDRFSVTNNQLYLHTSSGNQDVVVLASLNFTGKTLSDAGPGGALQLTQIQSINGQPGGSLVNAALQDANINAHDILLGRGTREIARLVIVTEFGLTPNGAEINLVNLTTTTGDVTRLDRAIDALSAGPSDSGNNLIAIGDYIAGANYALLGNVNIARGNAAIANYVITDGFRPGNNNLVLNINASTGLGLHLPSFNFSSGNTDPVAGPVDYSIFGSSLNYAAFNNFDLFPADPLVLDIDGSGVRLTSYEASPVLFDADNDRNAAGQRTKEQMGWMASGEGMVVQDLNGNGVIDGMDETLSEYYAGVAGGNASGNAGSKPFANGFAALKSLDSNGDNQFTAADAAWNQLRIWTDANHDGKTDAGELKTFAQLGITVINLASTKQSGEARDGNEVLARGTFTQTVNGVATNKEAIAANFLANPAGSTVTQSGSGLIVSTENLGGNTGNTGAIAAFVSQNTLSAVNEVLNAATLNVRNVTGGAGADTLTGDAQANWLAGGLGADSFSAGAGDDVLLIDAADSHVDGGDGLDVAQVIGSEGVTLNLAQSNIEIAVGGDGNDVLIGGGRSTVFVRGGGGHDVVVGGAANDVLSGEDGDDLVDGGAGNDLIRGHRGQDQLLGGAGDDVLDGGLEDDQLSGGAGNDVLTGGRGDDVIDGGDGLDVAEYSGSYADYRITKIRDNASGESTFRVVDTRTGQDGADTLTSIEKLSFSDVSRVELTLGTPLPVKDILTVNSSGAALSRTVAHLLSKNQLLQNDRDWDSDPSQLRITEVLEAKGGTAGLTAQGDILFTPDVNYTGVMSFKYKVQDAQGNASQVISANGQTEPMKAAVYLQTADLPADPLALEQWYLTDTNVFSAWGTAAEQAKGQGYSGKGIKIGQFEPGGQFSAGPEVFDYRHPDLAPNADKAWLNALDASGNSSIPQTFSSHATMVAGVMVAARNGEGGVGVAYNASVAGNYILSDGSKVGQFNPELASALARFKNYDIVNNSWSSTTNFALNVLPTGLLEAGIYDAIHTGRGGLGTAIVMAGGNDREHGANTNYNALTANQAVITAGSINAPGDLGTLQMGSKPFSNPGASILVSAPGSNIDSTNRELMGDNGSTFGSQYSTSQGTSFAAPIVSGIIALMLEANPSLGYRDIQTILAMSATKVDDPNGTDWTYNTARNWNGGGMHASHDYGFGKVDARAAVRLAESWTEQNTAANQYLAAVSSGPVNLPIPDGGMLTRMMIMSTGLEVESAQVTLELSHQRWGDLIIKLIAPSGTESVLVNRPGKAPGSAASDGADTSSGVLSFSFNSTHFLGEQSGGAWTLQVIDAITGNVGTLQNWRLELLGKLADAENVYVYTNEFASFNGTVRNALEDVNGGRDTLNASAVTGNSTINLNNGSSSILAGKALTVSGDIEIAFGGDGHDILTGNALNNVLLGGRGADVIDGGAGDDTLDSGRGNDVLTGGAGSDLFVISKDANSQDTIIDLGAGASASVVESIALVGFGNLSFTTLSRTQVGADTRLDLGEGQSVVLRNQQAGQLTAAQFQFFNSQAALQVWQLAGQNRASGSGATESDDVMQGSADDDVLSGLAGNDTLMGMAGNDKLLGGAGLDMLDGGAGNDVLVLDGDRGNIGYSTGLAGMGARTGGSGADRFLVAPNGGGAIAVGLSGSNMIASNLVTDFDFSQDKIDLSQFSWITSFGQLTISKAFSFNGKFITRVSAQSLDQSILAVGLYAVEPTALTAGNFIFFGSPDATPMPVSTLSSSTVAGAPPLASFSATEAMATMQPGAVDGTASNDTLTGDAGANILNGLGGADAMTGRTGDDKYIADNAGDLITELPGGGYDSVQSSVSYALSNNVEALTLTGTANLNATGNSERNRLVGNTGDNRLDGGAEADNMLGGAGNDSYVVDTQLDTLFENANAGIDTVESSVSWTLGSNFENLTLTGTANANATGNELANVLTGNAGDNTLDGAQGADTMVGGAGNDTFYLDNAGDQIIEGLDGGIDTVYTNVNLTLANNVENATLFGAATTLTGNALDNTLLGGNLADSLSGGAGDDVIDGGAGADVMAGGTGNDAFFVANVGDIVVETSGQGLDAVISSLNYTLGDNVENLTLTGNVALNGTGNALENYLNGNAGDNILSGAAGDDTLDGGMGNDTLKGGQGNDFYVIDSGLDVVIELANEGTDTLQSYLTDTTLGANIENLILLGAPNASGTGNSLNNIITGNAGDNILDGGAGADTLSGGNGNDRYRFNLGGGRDTIVETSGNDRIVFGSGINAPQITASMLNGQVTLSVASGDSVSFAAPAINNYAVEQFEFSDGSVKDAAWLNGLVNIAPAGANKTLTLNEDNSYTVTATDLGFSDANPGDGLSAVRVDSLPAAGSLKLNGAAITAAQVVSAADLTAGRLVFSPVANANGNSYASLSFSVKDQYGAFDAVPKTLIFNVSAVNDVPILTGTKATLAIGTEDTAYTITQASLLAGFSDVDGNALSVVNLSASNGSLSAFSAATGNWAFTPNANFNGTVNLSYGVSDGSTATAATQSFTLAAVNDAPTLTAFTAPLTTSTEDTEVQITLAQLQAQGNEADIDGTVNAFVIKTVNTGSLRIGATAATATAWSAGNNTVDASRNAYWTSAANANGTLNAFTAVAKDNGGAESATAVQARVAITAINDAPTGTVTITGTSSQTQTMTAANTLADVDGLGAISYQWLANGAAITGATGATFTLGQAQVGKTLSVKASYTDGFGAAESVTSAASGVVANVNDAPTGAISLFRSGAPVTATTTVQQGDTLSATNTLADADGMGPLSYQWQRFNGSSWIAIDGATADSLTLAPTLAFQGVRLAGFYIDGFGSKEIVASATNIEVNRFNGTAGADTLTGTVGADLLFGLFGNDSYIVNNLGDVVVENFEQGTDTVTSSVDCTLWDGIENMLLTGTALKGTGNGLGNTLTGNDGNNVLKGGFGADTLIGGDGDDVLDGITVSNADTLSVMVTSDTSAVYYPSGTSGYSVAVANGIVPSVAAGQSIRFQQGGGGDSFKIYVTPGSHVDLSGLAAYSGGLHLSGELTDYSQMIDQNTGVYTFSRNLPEGQSESAAVVVSDMNARLYFADGYIVLNGGADVRLVSMSTQVSGYWDSYWSPDEKAYVEDYVETRTDIRSYRPIEKNWLTGGAQDWPADVPLISQGADRLVGGLGNDCYFVDDAGDVATELANEGTDTVQSYLAAYTLGANVENLTLLGNLNANGTGNALNNIITGNAGNNTLAGGAGSDTYAAYRGMGQDRIVENDTTPGITDVLSFGTGVNANQLWFRKTGNHLEASIIGTADKFTVQDWYSGSQYHVEQIRSGDGKVLQDSRVDQLVQAMAGFVPPVMGQMDLSAAQLAALAPVLAANWQ